MWVIILARLTNPALFLIKKKCLAMVFLCCLKMGTLCSVGFTGTKPSLQMRGTAKSNHIPGRNIFIKIKLEFLCDYIGSLEQLLFLSFFVLFFF